MSVTPTANGDGWNNEPVTIDWSVAPASANRSGHCAEAAPTTPTTFRLVLASETGGETKTCTATNGALADSAEPTRLIKIDLTNPTISGSVDPPPNGAGWNNTSVVVKFQCSDNLSGVRSCPDDTPLTNEGRNQSVSGTAFDNADNSTPGIVSGINIDKTPPTTTHSLPQPARPGGIAWYSANVPITFNAVDPLLTNGDLPSDVESTQYRLNGGPWLPANGNVVIEDEALRHVVEYFSIDRAGNQESIKRFEFMLLKHVLFSGEAGCSRTNVLDLDVSNSQFSGLIHGNGHTLIDSSSNAFDGAVTGTCGAVNDGSHNVFTSPPALHAAKPQPPSYVYNDFPCSMTFTSNTDLAKVRTAWLNNDPGTKRLKPGVYCSTKDLSIGTSHVSGEVTLVAQGRVVLGGSHMKLTPFFNHVLAFSASTSTNAIELKGASVIWEGVVVAPNGRVRHLGSHSISAAGAIVAKRIGVDGNEIKLALPR